MLYLGVDSGGTKAAFLLTDETGRVIARHREPGCTALSGRKEGMKRMLENGIAAICQKAQIDKEQIDALGLGICGYGEGETAAQETHEACEEAFLPGRYVCALDTYIGWAGSLLFTPGINIIAGTGSVVYGAAGDGRTARAGGWGAGCDEGSCTWLGQRLLEAYTKQADGRVPRTALYQVFRDHYGITGDDEHFVGVLNHEVYRGGKGLAQLQYLLRDAWLAGDPVADGIYRAGAKELFAGVEVVARKLDLPMEGLRVSYSGGLFKAGECALSPLRELIESAGGVLAAPVYEPEVGAVMMAIRSRKPGFDPAQFILQEV
ncbi:MAG: hypothetical protein IKK75_12380 [Clostridia bacterium]|nr:hypothetical protein [Clostridia bacterium]